MKQTQRSKDPANLLVEIGIFSIIIICGIMLLLNSGCSGDDGPECYANDIQCTDISPFVYLSCIDGEFVSNAPDGKICLDDVYRFDMEPGEACNPDVDEPICYPGIDSRLPYLSSAPMIYYCNVNSQWDYDTVDSCE